jgi:hypothetical protein
VARGRGRRRTAPVQVLLALVILVLLLVVVPRLRSSAEEGGVDAGPAAPSPSGPAGDAPASASGPAYGPGPQQDYAVHRPDPPGSCRYRYREGKPLPDPRCTPGALNPRVTPATLARTICRSGYSSQIRPPAGVTDREKADSARAYGYSGPFRTTEYDHLVPIGLGGDPNDNRNLWLQPNDVRAADTNTNGKDAVEDRLHDVVCDGGVDLAAAQRAIAADWTTALVTLGMN